MTKKEKLLNDIYDLMMFRGNLPSEGKLFNIINDYAKEYAYRAYKLTPKMKVIRDGNKTTIGDQFERWWEDNTGDWTAGNISCDLCGHTWVGVYPHAIPKLECPNCENMVHYE